jgi:hypothetical protein
MAPSLRLLALAAAAGAAAAAPFNPKNKLFGMVSGKCAAAVSAATLRVSDNVPCS